MLLAAARLHRSLLHRKCLGDPRRWAVIRRQQAGLALGNDASPDREDGRRFSIYMVDYGERDRLWQSSFVRNCGKLREKANIP